MPVSPALTAGEITALAGPSQIIEVQLYAVPSTIGATAVVSATPTFPATDISIGSTSVNWLTYAKAGRTCWIGTTAGARDVGTFRLRKDATTGTLYLMQVGSGDAGRRAFNLRTASIASGQYVSVLQSGFDLWSAFPRINYDGTTATFYKDCDTAYSNQNSMPAPMARLGKHQVYEADAITDKASVSITANVDLWPTSSSVSYAWSYPASWTSVSGATSATLTGSAPSGYHEATCTVTDNNGSATVATRSIWVKGTNLSPYPLTTINSDMSTPDGWRMLITLNDNLLAAIPEGTMVHVHVKCAWNNSTTSVPTAIVDFTGWLVGETWTTTPGLRSGQMEIVGPAELLRRLDNYSQRLDESLAPASWQEVLPSLCKARFMIWYMLAYHAANFLRLFDFTLDSTGTTDDRLPALESPRGSLWAQIKALAWRAYLDVTCDETGAIYILRHPNRTAYASPGPIVTRATLTESMYQNLTVNRRISPPIGMQKGEALSYPGYGTPVPYLSHAPGKDAPGQSVGENVLSEQIVDNQDTLNTRTGLEYGMAVREYDSLTLTIKKAYSVIAPAHNYFVALQNVAALMPRGSTLALNAIPIQVSRIYQPGMMDVEMTFMPETAGVPGETKPVDQNGSADGFGDYSGGDWAGDQLDAVTDLNVAGPVIDFGAQLAFDPAVAQQQNPKPNTATSYGELYNCSSDGFVVRSRWSGGGRTDTNISPNAAQRADLGTVIRMVVDPFNLKRYVIRGTTGIVWTNDITASTVVWSQAVKTTVWTTFDSGGYPYTLQQMPPGVSTVASGGNPGNCVRVGPDGTQAICQILVNFSRTVRITKIAQDYYRDAGAGSLLGFAYYAFDQANATGTVLATSYDAPSVTGGVWATHTFAGLNIHGVKSLVINSGNSLTAGAQNRMDNVKITFDSSDGIGTPVGDFQGVANRKNAFYWLSYATVSGTDYLYFNRTLDFFQSVQSTQIAKYSTAIVPSFTVRADSWQQIYVSAGDTADSSAAVYKSVDGGMSFTRTACNLLTHGGQLWWNRSTTTNNTRNTLESNLMILRGVDGSNNVLIRQGISGGDVTIVTDATRYGQTGRALWVVPRNLSTQRFAARTGHFYISANAGASWSAATSVPGGTSPVVWGIWGWPTAPAFSVAHGYHVFAYTTDSGTTWTDMWSTDYDTWRNANLGSGAGETIVSVLPRLDIAYPVPVTS